MYKHIDHGKHSAVNYYRQQGLTLRALATKFDVCPQRISQMLRTYGRLQEYEAKQLKNSSAFLLTLSQMEWTHALQEPR